MSRHWFGQSPADWTFSVGDGDVAVLQGGVQVTAWSAPEGGVQYEDLLDAGGVAITSVVTGDGSSAAAPLGTIPRFQGPDGITSIWADSGGGGRYQMVATDLGDTMLSNEGRLDNVENTVDALSALAAVSVVTVTYDETAGTWPARPDIAGGRIVFWFGPVASPPPAGFMAQNDQFFGWQA